LRELLTFATRSAGAREFSAWTNEAWIAGYKDCFRISASISSTTSAGKVSYREK
jgi:hypothetical protein